MVEVVVVGGGWAGCAAALAAAKVGGTVTLLERTDQLLGTGLVGGIMRNNGRFTAAEEAIALGAGELFHAADGLARHKDINFPGHRHATLYDVAKMEPVVRQILLEYGVEVMLETRVGDVHLTEPGRIAAVHTDDGRRIAGDVFVEATGTAGPQSNCHRYGNGCVMCVIRCPSFGPRISLAAKAGVKEMAGGSSSGKPGAMSGSCKLLKESLALPIQDELNSTGVAVVPLPAHLIKPDGLEHKACQQYNLAEYAENIVLLDTGHAKLMTPFFPLDKLRTIPGFTTARFEDPYAGSRGNSIRFLDMSPRNNGLQVEGMKNLFCAGEKAGPLVGHTEAIVTGSLAGYNAVAVGLGQEPLILPSSLACGDAIAFVGEQIQTSAGLRQKYTFSGSVYFVRMKELGLYSTTVEEIHKRVKTAGLVDVLAKSLSG